MGAGGGIPLKLTLLVVPLLPLLGCGCVATNVNVTAPTDAAPLLLVVVVVVVVEEEVVAVMEEIEVTTRMRLLTVSEM